MLTDQLKNLIRSLSEEMKDHGELDAHVMNCKRGLYDMPAYRAPINYMTDYHHENIVTLEFKLEPEFISTDYSDTSFLIATVNDDIQPVKMKDLKGAAQNCVHAVKLMWTGQALQNNQVIRQTDDIQFVKGETSQQFRLVFHHLCHKDFILKQRMKSEKKWLYRSDYWSHERENEKPLIPFGLLWPADCDLDQSSPMLATLRGASVTSVGVKSYDFWQQYGLSATTPADIEQTRYALIDREFDSRTLGDRIKEGAFQIELQGQILSSCGYLVVNKQKKIIQIKFS